MQHKSISHIFSENFILVIRNHHFSERCDCGYRQRNGYKAKLFTLAKNHGFVVLIFTSPISIKKMADTTYCGPPFVLFLGYLDISQSKTMNLIAMLIT